MQALIDWANDNAGSLNLLFAAMVAIATVVTTILNRQLVRETVALRKAETDPDIALYIESRKFQSSFFDVVLRNVGRGAAYNVSFVLDRYWAGDQDAHFSEMALFRDGLTYLAPDQESRSFVGTYHDLDHGPLTITVTYHGKARRMTPFAETFVIDVSQFEGTVEIGESLERKAVRALEQIPDDVHYLRLGWWTLKVRLNGVRLLPEKRRASRRRPSKRQRLLDHLRKLRKRVDCLLPK